jgi:hypothetical protein
MVADSTKGYEWGTERLVRGCYAICVRNKAGKGEDTHVNGPRTLTLVSNFLLGSSTNGSRALTRRFEEGRLISEEVEAT